MFPDGGRFWKICQDHGITIFYTAPTAIRALMKLGDEIPGKYDLSRLRVLGSVGEPINPEAWMWYHRVIGAERCPIVDTWWQTETGAIMISPVPGATATKPGSCTQPLPGIDVDIVDDHGDPVKGADAGGYLVIRKPWPSMLRTLWGDNERYVSAYWGKFNNRYYVAGDSAHRDKDGYYWIMGRIDDVLNVAGHRLGTMEVESALVAHPRVAEAAVVGKPHEIKGESVFAFVVCRGQRPTGDTSELVKELRNWVGEQLGAIAKPDDIRFGDNLPKTRSGKIMRRVLKLIARDEEITQDVSTLENPGIIDQLRGIDSADAPAAAAAPKKAGKKAVTVGNDRKRAPIKAAPEADAAKADAPKVGARKKGAAASDGRKAAPTNTGALKADAAKAGAAKKRGASDTGAAAAKNHATSNKGAAAKGTAAKGTAKRSASAKRAANKATGGTAKPAARASTGRAAAKPAARPSSTGPSAKPGRAAAKTNKRAARPAAKRPGASAAKANAKPAAKRAVKRGKPRR